MVYGIRPKTIFEKWFKIYCIEPKYAEKLIEYFEKKDLEKRGGFSKEGYLEKTLKTN